MPEWAKIPWKKCNFSVKSISRKFIIHMFMPLCTHLHWYIETSFCCSSSPSLIMTLALKTSKQLQKQHQTAYWSRRNTHSLSDTLWPSSSRQEMRIATTKNCIFGFLVRDHQDDGGRPFSVAHRRKIWWESAIFLKCTKTHQHTLSFSSMNVP